MLARSAAGLILSLCQPVAAQSYRAAPRPEALAPVHVEPANEVMILGSPHLAGAPSAFRPKMLGAVLDRLAHWRPVLIAIEDVSGLQCDALRRYPARYAETVADYCHDTALAANLTGLDVPTASAEADRLLAGWPKRPTAAQRRRLAAIFLAAGERSSALVQWLRLPAAERRSGGTLAPELALGLERLEEDHNESASIGAALAARLGLERVWSVDDHSADSFAEGERRKAYERAIAAAWDNPDTRAWQTEAERINGELSSADGVLSAFRRLNSPEIAKLSYKGDLAPAIADPSPERFGRAYAGYWETRNLRMASNIRDVQAGNPGTRMLVVVGASHKSYIETYLGQMHDVRLVDAKAALE